ncbi:MAG: Ig-like domain-containing protein, partial [Myxococcaceae bacterium]|nr:Ig-like domain-containing protein [Myxococcaceae bacterium]
AGGATAGGTAGGGTAGGATAGGAAGGAADTTPPTILSTAPQSGAIAVSTGAADAGATLSIEFSEPIVPGSFTLTLTPSRTLQAPVFTNGNANVSVTTSTPLAPSTSYTATVTARDVANNLLAAPTTFSFTTAAPPDVSPPTVSSTVPANGASNVSPTGLAVSVTFNESVSPSTVEATINAPFSLGTPTLSNMNRTATWAMPVGDDGGVGAFANSTTYSVGVEATDVAGNAMASPFLFSFTTASPPDTTPPTLSNITPNDQATGVPTNSSVVITFNEPMNTASVQSTLRFNNATRAGSFTWNGTNTSVRFTPAANWSGSTSFTVAFATPAPTDVAGNPLPSFSSSFTSGPGTDTSAAANTDRVPAANATGVPVLTGCSFLRFPTAVSLTFSSAIDRVSMLAALSVRASGVPVAGRVSFNAASTQVTFTPLAAWAYNTVYTVRVNDGSTIALDLQGNPLANVNYTFTTMRQVVTTLVGQPAASGRVLSAAVPGQSTLALNVPLRVGEFNSSVRSRAFIKFPIESLPSNIYCITQSTLTVEQSGVNNTPYGSTNLGNVLAEVVSVGDTFEAADYGVSPLSGNPFDASVFELSTDPTLGTKSFSNAGQVRVAQGAPNRATIRWRLRFASDSAAAGTVDNATFTNTASTPVPLTGSSQLVIRYEIP